MCQAGVMTNTQGPGTEPGYQAQERAHSSCVVCMSLSETDKRERSWLQLRSEVREPLSCTLHTMHGPTEESM